MENRKYDIVLLGATGFTGSLVAEYFAQNVSFKKVKWALAGRNTEKLNAIKNKLIAINPECEQADILQCNSENLSSLENVTAQTKIIVTTVQKFPFIIDEIGTLQAKKFAIIIDEAHSSQSGETASKMNWVLSEKETPYGEDDNRQDEDPETSEDAINQMIEQRKMLKNASYFAFTATPKNKTLETFGTKTPEGKFVAFDAYTMKQAIEEEFILDVLKNYTTYQSYYKLNKAVEDNPEFETHQANKKLRAYVESHPFSIMEKSKVMIDHFHSEVAKQINRQAKAMVVCKSINNAFKYYDAFKTYLKEINSPYKAIIAFSGSRQIEGVETDEAKLNGFPSNDIPKEFKKKEYRFLIVANKFQTGFDQPLLQTMYVDKKLG